METSKHHRKGKQIKATAMPDLNEHFSAELLAKAITAKRTHLNLRIIDVAKALSLSKQTLVKIEKGDTKVNFINLLKVMEFLGLSFKVVTDEEQLTAMENIEDEQWF